MTLYLPLQILLFVAGQSPFLATAVATIALALHPPRAARPMVVGNE